MISPRAQLVSTLIISQVLRVAATLVMARFVPPADYGAYALLLAASALIMGLGDFGIPTSLVRIKHESERVVLDTAMALAGGLYIVYGVIIAVTGVVLAMWKDDPRMIWIGIICGITFWLTEIYYVQMSYLNRQLRFGAESWQNIVFSISQTVTGVALAVSGWGIYAIVVQQLVGQVVANIAMSRHAPLKWPTHFSKAVAKEFLVLGGKVSAALYVSNAFNTAMALAFKSLGGDALLGCWNRATTVQALFSQNVLAALDRVFFTSICASNDQHRNTLIVEGIGIYSAVACLMAAWFFVSADDLVLVVLGPAWMDAIPLMKILALAVPASAIYGIAYAAVYSTGKTGVLLITQVVTLAFFVPALVLESATLTVDFTTGVYVGSRYFIAVVIMAWVVSKLRIRITRMILSPIVSIIQGILVAAIVIWAAEPIGSIATHIAKWLPDRIGSHVLPIDGLIRLIERTIIVFSVYILAVLICQPRLAKRLFQLTARKKETPVPDSDLGKIECLAN